MHTTNTNLSKTPHTPLSLPPHSRGIKRKFLGFTLVELIVVITILVILGTIAFINLGGFAGSARDSARISNLANLQKGLNVYQVKTGTYPMPESSVAITASGTPIGFQGFAKDIVGGIAKLSQGGTVDPSDSNIYTTYAVNQTQTKMQAMVFLEDSGNVTAFNLPLPLGEGWGEGFIAYASLTSDYSKRFPKTSGDTLGILLSTATGTLNQPVQESGTGVDVVLTNTGYLAVFSKNVTINGSGNVLSVVSSMGAKSCNDLLLKDSSKKNKDGVYYINPTGTSSSSGIFQVYCDMTTDGGGWTAFWSFNKANYQLPADNFTHPVFLKNTYLSGSTYSYTDTSATNSWNIPLQDLGGVDGNKFDILATIPGTCERYIKKNYIFTSINGTGAISINNLINTHNIFSQYGYAPQYGVVNHIWHKGTTITAGPYIYQEKKDCQFGYDIGGTSFYPDIRMGYIRFTSQ